MKKLSKFILALAALCCVLMCPVYLYAEEATEPITGYCGKQTEDGSIGENLTYSISEDKTTLTISGIGEMADYYYDSSSQAPTSPFYKYRGYITSVVINEGVTSVGDYAFWSNNSKIESILKSVHLPDSMQSTGTNTFVNCVNLTDINIPNGMTTIKASFGSCTSLKSINIPDSVTTIESYAFHGCTGLESVTIPAGITVINAAVFNNCTALKSITIPKNVVSIEENAFGGCGLTELAIPSNVKTIGDSAFSGCSLTSLSISEGVETIGVGAFSSCESLTGSVTIPETVVSIGDDAFYRCSSLDSITVLNNETQIGTSAFKDVKNLRCYENSTAAPYSSYDGTSPTKAYITTMGKIGESLMYTLDSSGTLVISGSGDLPDYDNTSGSSSPFYENNDFADIFIEYGITSIGKGAFESCPGLSSVTIPRSVVSIGENAFSSCDSLTGVIFQNGLKTISDNAFYGCYNLTDSLTIPVSVTAIGSNAFYNCGYKDNTKNLEITILSQDTSLIIGENAFYNVKKLKCLDGSAAAAYSQTGEAAPEIVIIAETGSFGENLVYTIDSNKNLSVSGTGALTSDLIQSIKDKAMEKAMENPEENPGGSPEEISAFASVVIEKGITSIDRYAFCGCIGLESVTISESVTSIGEYAFSDCYDLTGSLTIPVSVTSIGIGAFRECSSLESITVLNKDATVGKGAFNNIAKLRCFKNSVASDFMAEDGCATPAIAYIQEQGSIDIAIPKLNGGKWIQRVEIVVHKDDKDVTQELTYYRDNGGDYIFPTAMTADVYLGDNVSLPYDVYYYYNYDQDVVTDFTSCLDASEDAGAPSDTKQLYRQKLETTTSDVNISLVELGEVAQ